MIEWLTQNMVDVLAIWAGIVTVASIIVKLTPSKVDDEWLAKILRLFEVIALNKTPVSTK